MSETFYQLSRETVLQAVADAGFHPTTYCAPLNALENRVFDVRLKDLTHVVAKFYRPGRWPRQAILEEHRFLAELQEEEIPVCAPLELAGGDTLREVGGLCYALWTRTGGRATDQLYDEDLEILGRLLARVHNVGSVRDAPERPRLEAGSFAREPLQLLAARGFLPPSHAARYGAAVEAVAALYEERSADIPTHRIHGDCHIGNLLNGRDGWYLLDFDDFLHGPAVQDVWLLVPGTDAAGRRQRQIFLDAYRQFRDFEDRWLHLVPPLRALRRVHRSAWVAERWDDPAFPASFPFFASGEYWEEEAACLEELLRGGEAAAALPCDEVFHRFPRPAVTEEGDRPWARGL